MFFNVSCMVALGLPPLFVPQSEPKWTTAMDLAVQSIADRLRIALFAHHRSGTSVMIAETTLDVAIREGSLLTQKFSKKILPWKLPLAFC